MNADSPIAAASSVRVWEQVVSLHFRNIYLFLFFVT
jgi:hypothetical protein